MVTGRGKVLVDACENGRYWNVQSQIHIHVCHLRQYYMDYIILIITVPYFNLIDPLLCKTVYISVALRGIGKYQGV